MPLPRLQAIEPAVADPKLDFAWDEAKVRSFYKPADPALVARLSGVTQRARIAFTLAVTEWVVFRFSRVSDDPLPGALVESFWAANVALALGEYWEPDDAEWRGPVRGPLSVALMIASDALFCTSQSENWAENPAWASKLAEHVLPAASLTSFVAWREAVLPRLENFYPSSIAAEPDLWDEVDTWGPPVPRELFDLGVPFHPEAADQLIAAFLEGR